MGENFHKNHRQRMRDKFSKSKFEGFADHEKLEMLLYYTIPIKNTNIIAHNLLNKFRTIRGVFEATTEQLLEVDGIGESTAFFLKFIPEIFKEYSLSLNNDISFSDSEAMCRYFLAEFINEPKEVVKAACFDDKLRIIACKNISIGDISNVKVDIKGLIEFAIKNNSETIVIAHNHPNGEPIPSDDDCKATKYIYNLLEQIGIQLVDHIIVAQGQAVSFRNTGFFNLMV